MGVCTGLKLVWWLLTLALLNAALLNPVLVKALDAWFRGVSWVLIGAVLAMTVTLSRLFRELAITFHSQRKDFAYTPAQAFWAFWIPFLNLVLPWYVISATLHHLENPKADARSQKRLHRTVVKLLLVAVVAFLLTPRPDFWKQANLVELGIYVNFSCDAARLWFFYGAFTLLQRIRVDVDRVIGGGAGNDGRVLTEASTTPAGHDDAIPHAFTSPPPYAVGMGPEVWLWLGKAALAVVAFAMLFVASVAF
jgi:hypothetical protein